MTAPSRTRPWRRLPVALAGLLTAFAIGALGQPPEEEDPDAKVKKKVVVEDEPVNPSGGDAGPGTPPNLRLDELARAALEAANPAVKELYKKYSVPFDTLHTKGTGRVRPIEHPRGAPLPNTEVTILGPDGQEQGRAVVNGSIVRKVDYFEEAALAEANKFLTYKPYGAAAGPEGVGAREQIAVAENLMAAALRFHDYARERGLRKGRDSDWSRIRKPLADRLREVRLTGLQFAVSASDWPRVREIGSRLMLAYPKDDGVAAEVASARVLEAKRLLASERHFDHVKAKELLDEFEARYPGGGGDGVKAIRREITSLAARAFAEAKKKKGEGDLVKARNFLAQAAALDPTLPDLRDLQRELKAGYQTLYVGVREYPVSMSPATARLDSERQAVELLFEGLLTEVPDDGGGVRYRPGAAEAMPVVVPGSREFSLRSFDQDATGRFGFNAHDVVDTVKLLRQHPERWGAYPLQWVEGLPTPKDNTTAQIAFRQGHPDPRALLTFKLLPARWMTANNKQPDDAAFAQNPFGTGPYRLYANPKPTGNAPREMVFVDNPLYGRWRDRASLPHIKEVRLVEVGKVHNVVESFRQGSMHVLTDVPTADLDKYLSPETNLTGIVQAYTAVNNRRVFMLAVNHRRPQLQNKTLRQGLSLAIDREAVLNEVFRAKTQFHAAMSGPFPPKSWANAKGILSNRDLAFTRLKDYLADPNAKEDVSLLYPEGDAQAGRACEMIKAQVEGLFKDGPGRKMKVTLEAVPKRELVLRVEDEHRYDLAYVPFEYPDDWYPYALGAMLDKSASGRGGRNWVGFGPDNGALAEDIRLSDLLGDLRAYRDFTELSTRTAEVHKLFNECLPFIPLWQIDRHMLVHNSVKVYTEDSASPVSPRFLNPTTLFQGVAHWRLEG